MAEHSVAIRQIATRLAITTDPLSKLEACKKLKAYSFDDDHFQAMRDADAIPSLISTLSNTSKPHLPLIQLAADAVWSLSADRDNCKIMLQERISGILAHLIHSNESVPVTATAVATLNNLMQHELTREAKVDFVDAQGVQGLLNMVSKTNSSSNPHCFNSEAMLSVVTALSSLSLEPIAVKELEKHGAIVHLIRMLDCGTTLEIAGHVAAILARMATVDDVHRVAICDAGGVASLIALCEDAVRQCEVSGVFSWKQHQAAQHGAAALWTLASNSKCKEEVIASQQGLRALAWMLSGRAGMKAEGNAAGALLAIIGQQKDPNSILSDVQACS